MLTEYRPCLLSGGHVYEAFLSYQDCCGSSDVRQRESLMGNGEMSTFATLPTQLRVLADCVVVKVEVQAPFKVGSLQWPP